MNPLAPPDISKFKFPSKDVSSTNTKRTYIQNLIEEETEGWNFLEEEQDLPQMTLGKHNINHTSADELTEALDASIDDYLN